MHNTSKYFEVTIQLCQNILIMHLRCLLNPRTKNYQKKITHIGSLAFQKVCALKLQRLFRGYTARKQFRTRLRAFYRATAPGGSTGIAIDAGQKQRRKQYYESEIISISNKLDQNLNKRSNQVDTMLRYMAALY